MLIHKLGSMIPFLNVSTGTGDQIFTLVKNVGAATASIGRAVVFEFASVTNTTVATGHDGFGVRLPSTTALTQLDNPAAFAGIVVGTDMAPGASGIIQQYGLCSSVMITATNAAAFGAQSGFTGAATIANFTNVILKPYDCFVSAATTAGALAPCAYALGGANVTTLAAAPVPGGYAMVANFISGTSVNIATTSTAFIKAFLRCL